ncbi:Hcp1 family type VI secretion system effector [Salmonella enterica subsp. enterica]|uniref:Hcp1 family type VI secretion system effector n=2 Tax=Salmonella enterica I TaxID=59201 RepID=A0A379WFZ6_SALET|nr:Hcp1 family type VI secretion system effector [Salmonella enterica subsp. enterica]
MAYDIFLKIDGIDGESMDDKHKNEIEVLSWRWNIHQESTMHAGSGLGSGKVSVTNLDFDHYIDRASPNLFKYCASGKHIPQAILVMRKAGGNPLEYLKYTFTDLIVAVVSPSGSHDGEIASRETVEFSFSHREAGIRGAEPAGRQRRHHHRRLRLQGQQRNLTAVFPARCYVWLVLLF